MYLCYTVEDKAGLWDGKVEYCLLIPKSAFKVQKNVGCPTRKRKDIFKEDIMKKVVLALLVVAIIGAMGITAVACGDSAPTIVECEELTMLMEGRYYVGTEGTVDLSVALPGSDYTVSGSNVSLSENVLTVKGEGDFNLTYKPTDTEAEGIKEDGTVTLDVSVVNGVNVNSWSGLTTAVKASKNVVLQDNLTADNSNTVEVINTTFYGNGKYVLINEIVKGDVDNRGNNGFNITDNNKAVFMDMFIYGYKYAEGEQITLENCEGYGQLINATNDDSNKRPSVTIKHCILENSQKMVYVRGANLVVDGTVMRNGADALLAAETSAVKGATLTVKNSVFANSVVCGIILCGWNAAANDESYCTLNLEGFVDIYNWKSRDTAKLMPATEGWYVGVVNDLVQSQLGKPEYNGYFTKGSDGMDYVHFGIVILATGKLEANNSKVNGAENVGLVQKSFPLPGMAASIAHTCLLYGIDPAGEISIAPTETVEDNTALSYELIHGRVKK